MRSMAVLRTIVDSHYGDCPGYVFNFSGKRKKKDEREREKERETRERK